MSIGERSERIIVRPDGAGWRRDEYRPVHSSRSTADNDRITRGRAIGTMPVHKSESTLY